MDTLYQDSLITLTDKAIVFHSYYFPFGGDKRVPLEQIEYIRVREVKASTGKFRLWGTSDFRTWYPRDLQRSSRDCIFSASLRNRFRRIGFTVENAEPFTKLLKARGLLLSDGVSLG